MVFVMLEKHARIATVDFENKWKKYYHLQHSQSVEQQQLLYGCLVSPLSKKCKKLPDPNLNNEIKLTSGNIYVRSSIF